MNLLIETREAIEESGHTPEDIIFIGSTESGHCCTWEEFQVLADIEYDDGYGAQEIASDLQIVFSDKGSMWRYEYDGSECWMYSPVFVEPKEKKPIKRLTAPDAMWPNLAELNK